MPYLNCVERCNQNDLLAILPTLFQDLKNGKLDTLDEYAVKWTHMNMQMMPPTTDLDNYILREMALKASEGVEMQCGREYWGDERESRATELYKMCPKDLRNLPTENMPAERCLSRFGYLASLSAHRSNKFFKAKRIKDDMMFYSSRESNKEVASKKVLKALKDMEVSWTHDQKNRLKQRVKQNLEKNKRTSEHVTTLLEKCKHHGGPFTNLLQVVSGLKTVPTTERKKIIRQEIALQRLLNPQDVKARPHLYRLNHLSDSELHENLSTLLAEPDEAASACEDNVQFPSEDESMNILDFSTKDIASHVPIFVFHPCVLYALRVCLVFGVCVVFLRIRVWWELDK